MEQDIFLGTLGSCLVEDDPEQREAGVEVVGE